MKILFFGTPTFAARILKYLLERSVNVVGIITKPDRAKGRSNTSVSTPVKLVAQSATPPIPVFQPEVVSAPEFAETLRQFQADLFVVVAYGEILKQHILDTPILGCINVHASLLPKYRGAAPIQRCLINGEKESGVTIMHMVRKMDAGDKIQTDSLPLNDHINAGELEERLCEMGAENLFKVIQDFEKGIVKRFPQDESLVTFAPKIEAEDCELNWARPAHELHNLVRGTTPHPGAWVYIYLKENKKRLKIIKTEVVEGISAAPGSIISSDKKGLVVGCGVNALRLINLQLEGKKQMSAGEFLRGLDILELSF